MPIRGVCGMARVCADVCFPLSCWNEVRPVEPRSWRFKPFSFKAFCFRELCEKTYLVDRVSAISDAPF